MKNLTITGFFWRFFERCSAQMVIFVVSLILARLLEPEVYGTIALVTVITNLLQVFIDSGLGNALIQKKDADDIDFSTVFYFNIVVCGVLYAGMFFFAPAIANFYNNSELVPIIRVLSLTLVISGVRNIQQAFVSRNMLFKKFFLSNIGGSIGAAIAGITMAYMGFGVWALVGQQLFNVLTGTVVLWFVVRWRPKLVFSFHRLKGLLSYGWKLLASAFIDTVYNDIRQLIIGKFYSSADLAFYNRGKQMPQLINGIINASVDSVLLPTMSKQQDDTERVKAMTRRAIRTSSYIVAPFLFGLAACGETLVSFILTDKWLDSVLFIRIFCVTYAFYPVHTANLNAIKAMGRTDMFLKLEIAKKVLGLLIMFSTIFISVEAMAYSLLGSVVITTMINAYPNKKLLKYSWAEQMKDILPNLGLSLFMAVVVYSLQFLSLPTATILAIQIITGACIYIGLSAFFKMETFKYVVSSAKSLLAKK
ncbi:MAG: lipopolysaccharide biosynthesis protein [Clostridia bacterium]|nr:lipopolysaccharide biosynthesis protein [Clostridia bacterium]